MPDPTPYRIHEMILAHVEKHSGAVEPERVTFAREGTGIPVGEYAKNIEGVWVRVEGVEDENSKRER